MKILVTGFEPFGGSAINPSEQAALALHGRIIAEASIVSAVLPVDWQRGPQVFLEALQTHQPRAVLCLGEAPTRPVLSVERVAINLLDFAIPDNSGAALVDQPIVPGGPAAYFSTLPIRVVYNAILSAGIPVETSLSAGSYLCNAVFYHLLHFQASQAHPASAGFIHLPRLPEQVAAGRSAAASQHSPSMSLETILSGLQAALQAIVSELGQ